ncbi:MAG: bifunctional phosphopantothenoylcysteine decarboxylase/phosphopantothenate--cysteine ligase CoaBC [Candidatus Eisenbacteria bacterium]|nr:bifunctional phosphopantothenoylcysteine decarboxylase/phosphopantothenate--cysteine ligase CoaBC [Candidatus Eisenbacteria bacterium]
MLRGRTVVVGVAGGIAAYKACELVRRLKQDGASVIVAMTGAAAEFVTPLTFETLSGNPVVRGLWGAQNPGFDLPRARAEKVSGKVEHVDVAEAAECVVIAPATADLMARLTHGEAPDALTALVLASRAPLIVCPSMDLEMWRNAATRENVKTLRARGATIVGPEEGALASGLVGPGRLAATERIVEAIEHALQRGSSLAGVRVLVSAGRTEEPIDPVRFLTNRSSGRMGFALAEAARDRGAEVTLVAGVTSVDPPHGVEIRRVSSAAEMADAVLAAAPRADVVLMAAAVSDYRPIRQRREKIKRSGATLTLDLAPNPDILARATAARRPGQLFVGFALETSRGLRRAREKLKQKGVDLVVLNHASQSLGLETNRATLVTSGATEKLPLLSKREAAERILDLAARLRAAAWKKTARAQAARERAKAGAQAAAEAKAIAAEQTTARAKPRTGPAAPRGGTR